MAKSNRNVKSYLEKDTLLITGIFGTVTHRIELWAKLDISD